MFSNKHIAKNQASISHKYFRVASTSLISQTREHTALNSSEVNIPEILEQLTA